MMPNMQELMMSQGGPPAAPMPTDPMSAMAAYPGMTPQDILAALLGLGDPMGQANSARMAAPQGGPSPIMQALMGLGVPPPQGQPMSTGMAGY